MVEEGKERRREDEVSFRRKRQGDTGVAMQRRCDAECFVGQTGRV